LFSARVANLGKAFTEEDDVCEAWQPLSLLVERFYCLVFAKARSCQRTLPARYSCTQVGESNLKLLSKMLLKFTCMFSEDKYIYRTNSSFLDYEFESTGPKGIIKKVARFSGIGVNVYNFGFGDLNEATGEISDTIVSNNGDGDKVLITVASIIYDFTSIYAGAAVFIQGSTASRTRRYQMGINKYWIQIGAVFEVFGLKNDKWEQFRPGENYHAFLGRRKAPFYFN
jgi:hypothetical protein